MQRQLSNVSIGSYQDYQPSRRYGPQYEPGGYAGAVQQRTNMTQREDALKFEQGRIKALQDERMYIQKKTFTKWINSFLQKARMEVEDLFVDLADGRRLLKLLEIISGERLPRPNSGRMRVHKIENVNKSLSFLHTKVRLESIGAEDIVDGNPRLILGLIWTIILRFQIQEIEIDVDEENESSEKKSAKDALLLWCQRKTSGYHGVNIHNFTDSWRSGLGFNALIHAHRPDLFRWAEVPATDHVETLNHAFDVAHKHLGIPKLLDAEDVDTSRPDEKSVMTYVASYYHTFARMKNEQKSGRRIANIIGQLKDCDDRKAEYSRLVSALLEWIRLKIQELNGRQLPNSLDGIQRLLLAFKQYRTVEKPPKYKERSEIEALYFHINTMQKSLIGEAWAPLEGQLPQDLERAWQQLEQAEHARELALRTELLRQQRLEQLNYKFNTKSVLRKGYLKEMVLVLSDPRYGSNLAQVDATVKKHEAISADILARTERFEDLSAMAAELVRENYHGAEAVSRTEQAVLQRWRELLELLERHRTSLARLAHLMALLREADTVGHTLMEMKAQFQSEEVGRHLVDVERLLQAHALQELQLGALDDSIRRLVRQGAAAEGPPQPKQQLTQQLMQLEEAYDSLLAAAKDRKARLEDARNLYQFLEDHDEEEGWVTDKQRICRADVAAKDLRGVMALRQKHTALLHELRARDHVSQRHRAKGQSLIDAKHPKSAEIERRLSSLNQQWEVLRELAAAREKQLADAAEAHQFYGDANEAESWMKEKRPLVATEDCGRDAPSAGALLARQRALHDDIRAYSAELDTLSAHAARLLAAGIHSLQLPTEVDSSPAMEEEEWVNESRLVPTEVWEEEPVERLEHRTVTEERSVPQVKALYAFTGQGISMQKGEVMFLINKTNPDWWSVRKADRTDGFVPANYVREIEPRLVPVQVRRPEKVRTVQRVKKTVLVKQVVAVRRGRPPARRASRTPAAPPPAAAVDARMADIQRDYDELLTLSANRRAQLEDAIKLYSFFAECDDFDKWIRDKEKMLRADDAEDSVDTAKRKYEKFVTDLSAASKRLEHIDAAAEELVAAKHGQAAKATARKQQLRQQWDRLLRLKEQKEKSLEGASSVELFSRTCDDALDWMAEKEQQLAASTDPAADLRTVRALQRRHAQLERELEPLKEKVNTVSLLADSVKSQYPNERSNVEGRQREIQQMWERCQAQAAERRNRLESAVGHQIFGNSSAQLQDWLQTAQAQLAQEATAKDVATAEALHKQHQELLDDIKTHNDEFKEVIGLGQQLLANNPSLTDVAEKIKLLQDEQRALDKAWQEKEAYLKQLVQLQCFNREADQIDATSGAHEAYLEYKECGASVDEAEALLKRHEELEARLAAQDERLAAFQARALQLQRLPHYAAAHIAARREAALARRDGVRTAAATRRRHLQAGLAHHQFVAATEELQGWIQDKTRTAKDQSYRDLANLERKLQKHEAFERELQANEKQLRNVESIGQSLQQSDPARADEVSARLQSLQAAWEELVAASRDKGSKLRQAALQRKHRRSVEDAKARLVELERELRSEEVGTDLRSCRRLLNQHQLLEQELSSWEQKGKSLAAQGADLVSDGHFDAPAIEKESAALLQAVRALQPRTAQRRQALDSSLQLHKFAAEVAGELDWLSERQAAASSETMPTDLHAAQSAQKKHSKLRNELVGRQPLIERVIAQGRALIEDKHPQAEKMERLCAELQRAYSALSAAAAARAARLDAALRAQQFLHDALELDAWLADKAAALGAADVGRDRHRATQLLTRHKAVELELDTYAAIISEMGHVASSMANSGHPEGPALLERHELLAGSLARLQRLAAQRQRALVESVCRHEYIAESAELETWIQEQYAAASSEDYGQDYEHLLILTSKFDELRHRVESGAERFNQCEELAKKLLASESPYIADIEKQQETLGERWQRLVEQLAARGGRLRAAAAIHRYHRDAAELRARAADKRALLAAPPRAARDLPHAAALLRHHDKAEADLLAVDAQLQVLQEEGTRLQKLYPGGNVQQISLQQEALAEAWTALRAAADERRRVLQQHLELHQFLTQARDLGGWAAALRAQVAGGGRVQSAAHAHAARADHEAARAELDAREDSFRSVLQHGDALVRQGHPAAQEIQEKCSALLEERARLQAAWGARLVSLDQLIDLHCFLRDGKQLHDLCAAQEAALGTEISPQSSVEEVDNYLKKHEAFEKLLATQDEKLVTLNSHGAKLLEQNHVESQQIADELQKINDRRSKLHALSAKRRAQLTRLAARAQFARDAAETRGWVADKLAKLNADQQLGEVTSLDDKIKKLQKHQAFTAELAANRARLDEIQALAEQLKPDEEVEKQLAALQADWQLLEHATEQRGRGLEEAQDILEFNQQLDKIEAWLRDKEMMVQAHELGRDYEHCSALLRKLDDLDSDMKVDDKHVKNICALADKLLDQGPTQQADAVSGRRDAFLQKWRALSGALQQYRDNLSAALEIHSFNRDVEETQERLAKKAALFSSRERGRELRAAQELQRRHAARAAEALAVRGRLHALAAAGRRLAASHPEHADHIEKSLNGLQDGWDKLEQLAAQRTALLEQAIAEHKFDESLKELEVWVSETVKRMDDSEPPESVADAEALLETHNERKAEIAGRQKAIAALQKEAPVVQAPEKLKRVESLAATLDNAWLQRKQYLTQAHQLQLLKDQARQTEDWLAAKEAFLNNDDLGDDLDAVETLIRKHAEFAKLLDSQLGRVDELERFAAGMLQDGHYDRPYIQRRLAEILARRDKLKESCTHRGEMLEQSRQLHQFLRNLSHEREWIALKMQTASDQSYRELSNLQSKIQKHAAFEAELAASKGRIDDVSNNGEELIEMGHYASKEISQHVEDLENLWRELQAAAKLRRERLQEAYQARVYLRGLDDFTAWLDDVEAQLLSEDHGKDLASVTALLKRHTRLEQQVSSKADTATQLGDNARQLAGSDHFMAAEILDKAEVAVKRYRQLQEPMQNRRDNLEDAALLHRWERDADEEMKWLRERAATVGSTELGSTLADAQALLKKHLALEAEIIAREPTISGLIGRANQLSRRGHFAAAALDGRSRELAAALRALVDAAAVRSTRLRERCDLLQLTSEMAEAEAWLLERRPALVAADVGRDQDSVLALSRRLDALQRELHAFDATYARLDKAAAALLERNTSDKDIVSERLAELRDRYEEMKLLSAKRQQRLQQSLKYFKFVQECEEVHEWIGEQMTVAASEDYGLDVEHVETLQQAFDNFFAQLQASEGRIEAVCEGGQALLEENAPEGERVRQRVDDLRGLWDDLRELALARQEALAGARRVHEFDRAAEETAAWVAGKEALWRADGPAPLLAPHALHAQRRRLRALRADLLAIAAAHRALQQEAASLGEAFPDAKEHVTAKLEDVTEALEALTQRADQADQQLDLAEQLQAYFGTYQELLAWTNEMVARVTAGELARDVAGAERLLARHHDLHVEVLAKDDAFRTLYADGEKLVREGHFMSSEIEERMTTLRARRQTLDSAWAARATIYEQHLDALVFKRDADALDAWITNRVPLVRDGKYGDSVSQVEELINKHRDLEETIESQKDKFNALKRITLVEKAFKDQKDEEAEARKRSAERQEAERLELVRRREVERLAEQRRREAPPGHPPEAERGAAPPSPETLSPAPQFDRLPKHEVKRAESMSVMKTPKRTPSFTTRRRTQSFRRHRADVDKLPPVEIEGYLERKQEAGCGGKRATVRSWRGYYSVLCGQLLCFFKDETDFANAKATAPPVAILNARCERASDYTKRANVFRLVCADGAEYLFACSSKELMDEWVAKLAFHAQLPPELQLTPYSPASESPTAELKRRLHENASSSSSTESTPEPRRKPRTQTEILQEHRNSQKRASTTPERNDRNIESTVLPSLPPRQSSQEDATDVILRNSEPAGGWGRSRFSNGRDLSIEFIRSQKDAANEAPPLPSSGPPDRAPAIPDRPSVPERAPALPERAPTERGHSTERGKPVLERGHSNSERGQSISDRGHSNSERGQSISDRGHSISERGQTISDRGQSITERMQSITERHGTERGQSISERGYDRSQPEKQSVTALVNSYQQRMTTSYQGRDGNRNTYTERPNNNWQNVETTSHFYTASELAAYANNSGTRPASIAGSGGSPALDQRPASRSSGESELSVSGVTKEKKDKKGVFGGLFSRKKRPQSHM
ncbi:spectrin alpha chain, non-erythrocytic 1 isoform X2 [Galleria mellonella]|uniref:Spectrin alpha chain, non-erythrocytic 1 isoform X2 n=1 Tax=Galleria mellonella TaxID=7137 RepID=A0ABM3MVX1_GALME|nr:spectrin alpha chain, non-erythrocytic 1 isoform X2 [Galleria mellonella]